MTERYAGPFTAENEARVCELVTSTERRHGLTCEGPDSRKVIGDPRLELAQSLE
jgi:hypothetical protein